MLTYIVYNRYIYNSAIRFVYHHSTTFGQYCSLVEKISIATEDILTKLLVFEDSKHRLSPTLGAAGHSAQWKSGVSRGVTISTRLFLSGWIVVTPVETALSGIRSRHT